jgi:hypothetical protein
MDYPSIGQERPFAFAHKADEFSILLSTVVSFQCIQRVLRPHSVLIF